MMDCLLGIFRWPTWCMYGKQASIIIIIMHVYIFSYAVADDGK